MNDDQKTELASVWDHLDELRSVLIRSLIAIALGMSLSFYFYPGILQFLTSAVPSQSLALFSPQEGFVAVFKLSFWMGVLATSPYWLFAILRFIQPALTGQERFALPTFIILSALFISAGVTLGLFVTIPVANAYLYQFNNAIGLNLWGFAAYLDYVLLLLFAHGATFEIGALLLLLVHLKIIGYEALARKRRHAVVISLIIGAILTPPDVLTQLLVAVPLYGFYELALLYGKLRKQ